MLFLVANNSFTGDAYNFWTSALLCLQKINGKKAEGKRLTVEDRDNLHFIDKKMREFNAQKLTGKKNKKPKS